MGKAFDVIVVGARCAGSPTAMLLARKGYRVLAVDRASFPSDTVSTHILHPLGVAAVSRWGLLDRLVATGCPPIHTYAFDFGPFTIAGAPGTDNIPLAYCPRRTILDKLLVDAAAEAGAEIRQGFTVEEIMIEGGRAVGIKGRSKQGGSVTEHAAIIVGADGRHSMVSEAVQPEQYREKPPLLAGYYSYWSGLPMDGRLEIYSRDMRAFAAVPTHDDLTLVIAGWPYAEFAKNKQDIEGKLPEDDRTGAGLCRAPARRDARSAICRRGGAELFSQALRPWLGARGGRRLQQGLHYRAGNSRCVPRRRTLRDGTRPVFLGRAAIRGCHG